MRPEYREKGAYGYLRYKKRQTTMRTLLFLCLTFAVFLIGQLLFHSNRSFFSIIAAVLCIPTAISAVNMIMFRRTKSCPEEYHSTIMQHTGQLNPLYDLAMTSYETTYPVYCVSVLEKDVICLMDKERTDMVALENHIRKILSTNGYDAVSVRVFHDLSAFLEAMDAQLVSCKDHGYHPVQEEAQWVPGTMQTISGILKSISL